VIVEIQCLPDPAGTAAQPYAHVDAAIAVVERSGLRYEVGALGSTVEGEPDELWPLVRAVHEACLGAGAARLVTVVKVAQWAGGAPPTIASLTERFR
jgi:uncharacterized protein YqgV (UPF0045/DUF77 family)